MFESSYYIQANNYEVHVSQMRCIDNKQWKEIDVSWMNEWKNVKHIVLNKMNLARSGFDTDVYQFWLIL